MATESVIQDLHICGVCRANFNDIFKFIQHKKESCHPPGSGTKPEKSETLFVQQLSTVDLQLPGIAVSHDPYQFSSEPLVNPSENQDGLQSSVTGIPKVTTSHVDSASSSLAISGAVDVAQYSYALNSQQSRSADGLPTFSFPWSSDQEIQTESVTTTADVNIVCGDLEDLPSQSVDSKVKSESMGYSSIGHSDHQDIATDNIAVYVVSPKSFASSVSNEAKSKVDVSKVPEYCEGSFWPDQHLESYGKSGEEYSRLTVAGKDWVTVTRSATNSVTTAHLNDFYSSQNSSGVAKLPMTTTRFYSESSELTPNSENSTPCPEDLEVGQISASMIVQKSTQGESQLRFGSNSGQIVSSEEEAVMDAFEIPAQKLKSVISQTQSKVNDIVTIAPEYIRQNTASAPIIDAKGSVDNQGLKNTRRISMEKRERLQGVSDDLLSSSPSRDGHVNDDCGQVMNSREEEQISRLPITTNDMLSMTTTTSVLTPTFTSYKAIFTGQFGAGHRLTPAQSDQSDMTVASTVHDLHSVKRQQISGHSKTLNLNSVLYRDISSSAKTKNEVVQADQTKNQNCNSFDSGVNEIQGQIFQQLQQKNSEELVEVKFPVNQKQDPLDTLSYRKTKSPNAAVTDLDELSLGSSAVLAGNHPSSSDRPGMCIIAQNHRPTEIGGMNIVNTFSIGEGATEQNLQCLDVVASQVVNYGAGQMGLTNDEATNPELSGILLQKGQEVKEQAQCVTLENGSAVVMYENSGYGFVMLPAGTTPGLVSQEQDCGYQSSELAPASPAKSTGILMSLNPQQYFLKQDSETMQEPQLHSTKAETCGDVHSVSDDTENNQQQFFIQDMTYNNAAAYTSQSQLVSQTVGNTYITSSDGTFIMSHTPNATLSPNLTTVDAITTLATEKSVQGSGSLVMEREKCILKPRKRKKLHQIPVTGIQSATTGPKSLTLTASSNKFSAIVSVNASYFKKEELPEKKVTKTFKCEHENCGYSTTLFKDFQRHYRQHTGERPYKCGTCGKSFIRSDKLTIHMRSHSGAKPYKCKLCDYAAREGGSLKKHMRIHTNERPFKCQICSYASRNSSQLIVHLRTHTGDAPFHCTKCLAKFKINSDLKRHMRVHTGEKPYQCEKCDYRSSNKGNLKTHMRINHSKENEIHCPTCDFVTSSKKRLQEHIKTHDTEGDLKCTQCDFTCSNPKSLRAHISSHSSAKVYQCKYCPHTSKLSGNLKKHIQNLHLDKIRLSKHGKNGPENGSNDGLGDTGKLFQSTNRENVLLPLADKIGNGKRRNLINYKRLHVCQVCGTSFMRQDSLKCHMKQHNPETNMGLKDTSPTQSGTTVGSFQSKSPPKPVSTVTHGIQGIQHIVDAASKLYEEYYGSEDSTQAVPVTHSHINSSTSLVPDSKTNLSWVSSSKTDTSIQGSNGYTLLTSSLKSDNSVIDKHQHKPRHRVPWEHRSYTLTSSSSETHPGSETHQSGQKSTAKPTSNSSHMKHSKRHHHHQHHTSSKNSVSHSSHKKLKGERTQTSSELIITSNLTPPEQQKNLVFVQQQQHQMLPAPDTSVDHQGISNISFTLPSQGGDNNIPDSTLYNIQLVPQLSGMPQDSSQIVMTQEFLRQLSMHTVAQAQPSAHVQVVLPGTSLPETAQLMSGSDQSPAPYQQIMLQVHNANGQREVITIPMGNLGAMQTTEIGPQVVSQMTPQTGAQMGLHVQRIDNPQTSDPSDMQIMASQNSAVKSDLLNQSENLLLSKVGMAIPVPSMTVSLPQEVLVSHIGATSGQETRGPDL